MMKGVNINPVNEELWLRWLSQLVPQLDLVLELDRKALPR
jgi:hypothetical protein